MAEGLPKQKDGQRVQVFTPSTDVTVSPAEVNGHTPGLAQRIAFRCADDVRYKHKDGTTEVTIPAGTVTGCLHNANFHFLDTYVLEVMD